jgi:hypothetical protein
LAVLAETVEVIKVVTELLLILVILAPQVVMVQVILGNQEPRVGAVEVATPGVHVMGRMAVAAVALLEMVRLAPEITEEERGALD